jgi:hypothetical protein
MVCRNCPLVVSHNSIRPSRCAASRAPLAIARVRPSGEKEIDNTTFSKLRGASYRDRRCEAAVVTKTSKSPSEASVHWTDDLYFWYGKRLMFS